MTLLRRHLVAASVLAPAVTLATAAVGATPRAKYPALAFDGFPIFDPRPVGAACEVAFPGKGAVLLAAWRTRQFEYQWLGTLMRRFEDFLQTTEAALVFAADSLKLPLDRATRERLVDTYRHLPVWSDAPAAISRLSDAGVRLSMVSNMTSEMLETGLSRAGLRQYFDMLLSTDDLRRHKPDRSVYEEGAKRLGLSIDSVLFVPFAAWDLAGARAAGHPTFWVNRLGMRNEELGATPTATGTALDDLVRFALAP